MRLCCPARTAAAAVEAAVSTAGCPYAALFFATTLLGIRSKAAFTPAVQLAYKESLRRVAPGAHLCRLGLVPGGAVMCSHSLATLTAMASPVHVQCPSRKVRWYCISAWRLPAAALSGYSRTLLALCAGATMIPLAIGPQDTGQVVQTVAIFPGRFSPGLDAAQALAARLRAGNLNTVFDERRFGRTHVEVLSQPFLASAGQPHVARCVEPPCSCHLAGLH